MIVYFLTYFQNPEEIIGKFSKLGEYGIAVLLVGLMFFALMILREWLKKKRDRQGDFMQSISDAMVVIKDEVVRMNKTLDEQKTATLMISGVAENMAERISKVEDVTNQTYSDVKILKDRDKR